MPRLSPRLIQYGARIDRHLPILLRECRDLSSARNELRWLKKYVWTQHPKGQKVNLSPQTTKNDLLRHYVYRRARGEPLQYLLGTQPFGDLEILCEPDVLIPRPETETYTMMLADAIQQLQQNIGEKSFQSSVPLTIADFCTGTGCIALLLHSRLTPPQRGICTRGAAQIYGYDISPKALSLAERNRTHNLKLGLLDRRVNKEVIFEKLNVLSLSQQLDRDQSHRGDAPRATSESWRQVFDVIVSNPPYISPDDFKASGTTTRSVRKFEPQLALVPPANDGEDHLKQADQFYVALLDIALACDAKLLVMEVGDNQQASRVQTIIESKLASQSSTTHADKEYLIEKWRDDGSVKRCDEVDIDERAVEQLAGDRAIVLWLGRWKAWRLEQISPAL